VASPPLLDREYGVAQVPPHTSRIFREPSGEREQSPPHIIAPDITPELIAPKPTAPDQTRRPERPRPADPSDIKPRLTDTPFYALIDTHKLARLSPKISTEKP